MSRAPHTWAFTLVELLVVVAIIAMLTGMLMPTLIQARKITQAAVCKSSLRSLGLATQLYAQEEESYPPAWVIGSPDSIAWCGAYYKEGGLACMDVSRGPLWQYLGDKKMLDCPSFSTRSVKYVGSGQVSGYGINCQYVAGDPDVDTDDGACGMTSYARPARLDQIRRPTETILFADAARTKNGVMNEEIYVYPLYKHDSTKANYATFHFRHDAQAGAGYCDGHANSVGPHRLDPTGTGACGWMANEVMDRN